MPADGRLRKLRDPAQLRNRELMAVQEKQQTTPGGVGQRRQVIENRGGTGAHGHSNISVNPDGRIYCAPGGVKPRDQSSLANSTVVRASSLLSRVTATTRLVCPSSAAGRSASSVAPVSELTILPPRALKGVVYSGVTCVSITARGAPDSPAPIARRYGGGVMNVLRGLNRTAARIVTRPRKDVSAFSAAVTPREKSQSPRKMCSSVMSTSRRNSVTTSICVTVSSWRSNT